MPTEVRQTMESPPSAMKMAAASIAALYAIANERHVAMQTRPELPVEPGEADQRVAARTHLVRMVTLNERH